LGLPIDLQLVGAKYKDALALRAAHAYEVSSSCITQISRDRGPVG
jgi:Asp-tRNA(Asn)/Glu-tRNA(Gln) amidotransferase A subunit family amidase